MRKQFIKPLGLLAEHRIGRWRVFVNAENLMDVRQTRGDPSARRAIGLLLAAGGEAP